MCACACMQDCCRNMLLCLMMLTALCLPAPKGNSWTESYHLPIMRLIWEKMLSRNILDCLFLLFFCFFWGILLPTTFHEVSFLYNERNLQKQHFSCIHSSTGKSSFPHLHTKLRSKGGVNSNPLPERFCNDTDSIVTQFLSKCFIKRLCKVRSCEYVAGSLRKIFPGNVTPYVSVLESEFKVKQRLTHQTQTNGCLLVLS